MVNEDAESREKTDPITNLRMDPGSVGKDAKAAQQESRWI